jgi:hypothetical protein
MYRTMIEAQQFHTLSLAHYKCGERQNAMKNELNEKRLTCDDSITVRSSVLLNFKRCSVFIGLNSNTETASFVMRMVLPS